MFIGFLIRLLIYYAYYKEKQAFLSFLPAFKPFTFVFPLFIGVFADFAAFSPFHAFLQHLPLFIGYFADQTSLLSPSASFIYFCLITRVFMQNALFHPFLIKFHYLACFYDLFSMFSFIRRYFKDFLGFPPDL